MSQKHWTDPVRIMQTYQQDFNGGSIEGLFVKKINQVKTRLYLENSLSGDMMRDMAHQLQCVIDSILEDENAT